MNLLSHPEFVAKAAQIKLMIFDVDGIFTDGYIFVNGQGIEMKAFHVLDGQGIKLLQKTSVQIAVISGRDAPDVAYRMQKLGIQHVFLGHTDKLPIYEKLRAELQLPDSDIAYMGDDLPDLPVMRRVGLSITVPNAVPEVHKITPWITQQRGGMGAVREVCEALLKAQGAWQSIIDSYESN